MKGRSRAGICRNGIGFEEKVIAMSYLSICNGNVRKNVCNPYSALFYGEWEATDTVYIDPMPVQGISYDEQELEEQKNYLIENNDKRKIQFTRETIAYNDDGGLKPVTYKIIVFPARDDYHLHFNLTLQDIGLTEQAGNYYVYVEAETEEDSDTVTFFIKDDDTLLVYEGFYVMEYRRVSYEGGCEEPVVILG